MSERDWQELRGAISDGSFEKASLRMLLRYDRVMKGRPAHEVPPAIRDQLRLRISQKVMTIAATMLVGASIVGGIIIWLYRLLS
jgi:hypothetical protein